MSEIVTFLIGGLVLFLFAITQLSEVLKGVFTDGAKSIIKRYTSNIFSAIFIGAILTVLLDSSSAVIILVIVFINARTLTFRQAIGLIMGANIGTTFSSQIIALSVGKYSIVPLLIGFAMMIFLKSDRWKSYGRVLLYFGMLFFGLFIIEQSVLPLKESEIFAQWISRVEDDALHGALIGGLITLIIQSSSGTVGMAIVLGKQQMLSAAGGIAIMLGAELGTCSDTLLATINGSRQALKAGLFHVFFNLMTIMVGLLLFTPFVDLIERISASEDIGSMIANAHMLFNILGVLIFLPFVHWTEMALNALLPDRKNGEAQGK
ncbi:Na/Pi cotransporter family protein [Lewinella sp. W8]|uniref:Na/Pi cotransporter family protein n=1 Tax=Lewinella sp. W8 TaxID=2528208 RepID=UPI001068D2F4|nr:Na/Pi symporter [Lewinella sp. W8]MTB51397.1 Na/Pi cotransporter family protein [Lewinella sp. W8]